MAFLLIFMMVALIIGVILIGVLLVRLQNWTKIWNEVQKDTASINHRQDCLDHQGHLMLDRLDKLSTKFDEYYEQTKTLEMNKGAAYKSFRDDTRDKLKAIMSGIEDRYDMIYEEFKGIKDMAAKPTDSCNCSTRTVTNKVKKEKALLAKQLKEAGKSVKDISVHLGVAESTVRSYLKEPGLISPDEEDHLGMPQIDDPAAYRKFVDKVIDDKLNNEAVGGKSIDYCPFNPLLDGCETACSDACHDCIHSARAFNLTD